MSDFIDGQQGSQAQITSELQGLQSSGTSILATLLGYQEDLLSGFDRALNAMNGRRQRVGRVVSPNTLTVFPVSDFLDIDQTATTATVRADVSAATLRERALPVQSIVRSTNFTTSTGSVEQLSINSTLLRVNSQSGVIPTGTFDIELTDKIDLTLLVVDIAATPSVPKISIQVSATGVTFTDATNVAMNGYRVNAWFKPVSVKFVRIAITPASPDNLSGSQYTFGITDFYAAGLQFQLLSDVVSKVKTINPRSANIKFVADEIPGITYYLSVGAASPFVEVNPGDILPVPGAAIYGSPTGVSVGFKGAPWASLTLLTLGTFIRPTLANGFVYEVTTSGTTGSTEPTWPLVEGNTIVSGSATFTARIDGIIDYSFPSNTYWQTVVVVSDDAPGIEARIAPGFSYHDPKLAKLTNRYIAIAGTSTRYVLTNAPLDTGKTFTLQYEAGPSSITCQLRVRFNTEDRTITPTFTGASIQAA